MQIFKNWLTSLDIKNHATWQSKLTNREIVIKTLKI